MFLIIFLVESSFRFSKFYKPKNVVIDNRKGTLSKATRLKRLYTIRKYLIVNMSHVIPKPK